MATTNPYKQGETTYQDTLIKNAGIVPGSTIPVGQEQVGANAGAPMVKPKVVVPITKAISSTTVDPQLAANQAMAKNPTNSKPITTVVPATTLDAQQMADQAMSKQYADQMLQNPQQPPGDANKNPNSGGSNPPNGTTPSDGTTPTGVTITTGQGGESVNAVGATTTQETVQDNPYQKQLETMKFDYSPQTDPEYLENASALENQVSQMMVGRGGLYSSVAQSAFQSKLLTLQNDFRTQKYTQFVQDRNFLFDQSKQWFSEQSTKWSQKQTEKEFDFAKEKEKFDQQMAIANYNLQVQAQQFSQSQARAAANQRIADANAAQKNKEAEQELKYRTMNVQGNATIAKQEREKYNRMLASLKLKGSADSEEAAYFNIPYGGTMSKYASRIANKNAYITSIENTIIGEAYNLGMDKEYLDMINSSISTNYLVVPTATAPSKTETVQYDSKGNKTGSSTSIRYGE